MMHRDNAKSEKEKIKFERMQEDHKKLLYPTAEEGQKKLGTTLELLQWRQRMVYPTRIWAVTGYPKEDASEGK
jgi:ABC-type metal ion transport system substrate-binding protein